MQQLIVKPETALIRPYVVAAILRGVTFDPVRYDSFIDLQVRGCGCGRGTRARLHDVDVNLFVGGGERWR